MYVCIESIIGQSTIDESHAGTESSSRTEPHAPSSRPSCVTTCENCYTHGS